MKSALILKNIFRKLSPVDLLNMAFLVILSGLFLVSASRTPYRGILPVIFLLILSFILVMIFLRLHLMHVMTRRLVMFIYPVISLFVFFESFYMLLPYFNPIRYDAQLESIDRWLFGVSPSLAMAQWTNPLLTEILYICYALYFPMPLIVLGVMLKRAEFLKIEQALVIFLTCYYAAYLTYFFVPAEGPRYFLQNFFGSEPTGIYLAGPIRKIINMLEPNKLDVFPSLHMAILVITMHTAFKHTRRLFYFFLPVAIGIALSLTWCRYHYIIDALAGIIFAIAAILIGTYIYPRWRKYFTDHFGENRE
jgi:membrane-associated phospholipid phosphatase